MFVKNSMKFHEKIHGISMEFHGIFRGNFHGIPWNSMENSIN
jgi:hypothetical protein